MTNSFQTIISRLTADASSNKSTFMTLGELNTNGKGKQWTAPLQFDTSDERLYLQLPICTTKNGIVDLSSKTYTDLMFDNTMSDVDNMVNAFLLIESACAQGLYEHSDEWFGDGDEKLTKEQFEDMVDSVIRLVKRQSNVCLRVSIPVSTRSIKHADTLRCEVYTKEGHTRSLSDIKADTRILPLVQVKDLKISPTSISLGLIMVECMIMNGDEKAEVQKSRRIMLDQGVHDTREAMENAIDETTIQSVPSSTVTNASVEDKADDVSYSNDECHNVNEDISQGELEEVSLSVVGDSEEELALDDGQTTDGDATEDEDDEEVILAENRTQVQERKNEDDNNDGLIEIRNLAIVEDEPIRLKKPDEVYKDIYKAAIEKARRLRQVALEAYLDAKKIKARYMLESIEDSDDETEESVQISN